jgi:flagellar basal body-associated protein FliL
MQKHIFISLLVVAAFVAVGVGLFFFMREDTGQPQQQEAPASITQPSAVPQSREGLGSQLNQNPGSGVPETNPFEKVKVNPFESYKNPFE